MYARWGVLVLSIPIVGCTATSFSSKQLALSSKSVFSYGEYAGSLNQPDDVGNGIKSPGGSDTGGSLNQPTGGGRSGNITSPVNGSDSNGTLSQLDGTNDEVDLQLICSDRRSQSMTNFKKAVAQNSKVDLVIDNRICTSNINEIKALVQKKSFTLTDAQRLCPGLVPATGTWANVSLIVDGNVNNSNRGVIYLLYALNTQTQPAEQAADSLCDQHSSPLVIHVASDVNHPLPIELSSQDEGIDFDLLGATHAYSPVRISWFTNEDYRLLALPNSHGEVRGIDQLFGNATIGPDGRLADNGYAALAKYDGTTIDGLFKIQKPDGRIDANDAIFSRLRLWLDKNYDGVSQPGELVSLKRARITFIDLEFSNDFSETDQYGNQTMMKSVVGYTDGSLDLIFDLWFAYR